MRKQKKSRLSRCYWWVLKKIDEPLKGIFILIGVFTVINFSFNVFVEYVNYKYQNEKITIVNPVEANQGDETGDQPEDNQDIPEDERVVPVDERIREIAVERGFSEVERLIKVLKCESSLKVDEIVDGDYKNYSINPINNSYDRGFAQYSRKYNPHISDECAFSLNCSVNAVIDDVSKGGWGKWSASQNCWSNQ